MLSREVTSIRKSYLKHTLKATQQVYKWYSDKKYNPHMFIWWRVGLVNDPMATAVSGQFSQATVLDARDQGWNDLHSLCRIGMEYYLLNNDDNNIIYWIMMMMMIIIMIIMMTMMIIRTIMIMIIIITMTLTMAIMKMIMIKTAQTPCQSLYQDRRI